MKTKKANTLFIFILMLMIFIFLSNLYAVSSDNHVGFVYISYWENQTTKLNLYQFYNSSTITVELPSFNFYTISPTKSLIAFTDDARFIHVLDLYTQEIVNLDIQIASNIELVYGVHQQKSGSLHWSPNGKMLAFVGRSIENSTDVFVYNTDNGETKTVKHNLIYVDDLIDITSWSPDSNLLTIMGRWHNQEDNSTDLPPFRSAIISIEGSLFVELGNAQRSCSIKWSPDQHYLVSETGCFENQYEDTSLLIFTFDEVNMISNQQRPLQLPLTVDDISIQMVYPQWLDNNILAIVTLTSAKGLNLSSNYPTSEIVRYDLLSDTYEIIPNSQVDFTWQTIDRNYLFSVVGDSDNLYHLEGYNLIDQHYLNSVQFADLCPVSNISITSSGHLIAVLRGCSMNSQPTIEIIDTQNGKTIFDVSSSKESLLKPLGFIELD